MIAHFVDSVCSHPEVTNHCCYNEQGAGFAAVGSAKATGKTALAYSTSGPGAANLISAIADAYYDSTPVVFISGQLNTYEYLGIDGIRQNGFQEMDVVSAVSAITKYAVKVEKAEDLRYICEKAYYMTNEGRQGPVLIDLPMDMQRQEIDPQNMRGFEAEKSVKPEQDDAGATASAIIEAINRAKAPLLLLGNGIVKDSEAHRTVVKFAEQLDLPIITSMLARDLLIEDHPLNFGHIGGGYGHRYANILAYKKADLIVSLGCSMCKRQTAMKTEKFAEKAEIIRVEIDPLELTRKVHQNEKGFLCDCNEVISKLDSKKCNGFSGWLDVCRQVKDKLVAFDDSCPEREPNRYMEAISECIGENSAICVDVGQHQVWASQSFKLKPGQDLLFSGGHGAMGFALPAAIGAYYGSGKRSVSISGDGAFQMNIQELQWVFREQIPMTMFVMNNASLGLIQQQQDDIFAGRYAGSMSSGGYTTPDFARVAEAYGIASAKAYTPEDISKVLAEMDADKPRLVEVVMDEKSRAVPKTYFGEEMYNQRPYIPESLMNEILSL